MAQIDKTLIRKIRNVVGKDDVLRNGADLFVHSYDASGFYYGSSGKGQRPPLIVRPRCRDDLVAILELLWGSGIRTVVRGAGTGMSGGALADDSTVVVVTDRLKYIGPLEGDTIWVEPGVVTDHLNKHLKGTGLFYAVDPASSEVSTIGGNIAENAGGPRALKYGVTGDNVIELEVISPAGGITTLRNIAGEHSDLHLIIGSEGTLAVILRAKLRLRAVPQSVSAVLATFVDSIDAGKGAVAVLLNNLLPARMEFIDKVCIECLLKQNPECLPADAGAVLLLEFDGTESVIADESQRATEILKSSGVMTVEETTDPNEVVRLWSIRTGLSPALGQIMPHKMNEDIAVPRSKIPQILDKIGIIGEKYNLTIPVFGHIGDGNLHVNVMYDNADADMSARAYDAAAEIMQSTVALGGTISGEHGVGLSKKRFLAMEQSPAEFQLAYKIKKRFDPDNLLNPGKIYDYEKFGLE